MKGLLLSIGLVFFLGSCSSYGTKKACCKAKKTEEKKCSEKKACDAKKTCKDDGKCEAKKS